jgi:hypothetical protein
MHPTKNRPNSIPCDWVIVTFHSYICSVVDRNNDEDSLQQPAQHDISSDDDDGSEAKRVAWIAATLLLERIFSPAAALASAYAPVVEGHHGPHKTVPCLLL